MSILKINTHPAEAGLASLACLHLFFFNFKPVSAYMAALAGITVILWVILNCFPRCICLPLLPVLALYIVYIVIVLGGRWEEGFKGWWRKMEWKKGIAVQQGVGTIIDSIAAWEENSHSWGSQLQHAKISCSFSMRHVPGQEHLSLAQFAVSIGHFESKIFMKCEGPKSMSNESLPFQKSRAHLPWRLECFGFFLLCFVLFLIHMQ